MSDVNIPIPKPPPIGAIVFLRGYFRSMVVTDILTDANYKPYAASVAWLDEGGRPCNATYPLACLESGE